MGDEWKGEVLIRGLKRKPGRDETKRLVNVIYHANRRKQGAPAPGAKRHGAMMKGVFIEVHNP